LPLSALQEKTSRNEWKSESGDECGFTGALHASVHRNCGLETITP
jgi:hypothetical protein